MRINFLKLGRAVVGYRKIIRLFIGALTVALTVLKLWSLEPDYDESNKVLSSALEYNTLALQSVYEFIQERDENRKGDFLKDVATSIQHSSDSLVGYLGEKVPGCRFPDVTWTVQAVGPAGKLVDYLSIQTNAVKTTEGAVCDPVLSKRSFWEDLAKKSREGHTTEMLIAFFGAILLAIEVFDSYVEHRYPPLFKENRKNPRPWYL